MRLFDAHLLRPRGALRAGPDPVSLELCVDAGRNGELGVDKSARATARTDTPALVGRIASGGLVGRQIAGSPGFVAGAVSAGAGTFVTYRTRKSLVETTGLPDRLVAVGEDLVAYSLAALATRRIAGRPPRTARR